MASLEPLDERFDSTGTMARILNVSTEHARRLARAGQIKKIVTPAGFLYSRRDVMALKQLREARREGRSAVKEAREVVANAAEAGISPVETPAPQNLASTYPLPDISFDAISLMMRQQRSNEDS